MLMLSFGKKEILIARNSPIKQDLTLALLEAMQPPKPGNSTL